MAADKRAISMVDRRAWKDGPHHDRQRTFLLMREKSTETFRRLTVRDGLDQASSRGRS
jgi:hypothetical protein